MTSSVSPGTGGATQSGGPGRAEAPDPVLRCEGLRKRFGARQAGAIGPALGMLLGLLGGTMVPAEVFPEAMRTASHLTPHAWAMDAFRGLLLRGETLVDIVPQLAVLAGFAVVLMTLAVWRFRRALVAG